ncbi:MAG TPA: DUF2306 domain-containing protein [Nocardioides sp.]|nr:DUF2306 domain-containing protein [Nocardioides sp.]
MTDQPTRGSSTVRRVALGAVVLVTVAYFPLAFTYTWHLFVPDAPRLQDELLAAAVSHDFAFGHGSVVALRAEEYAAQRVVLLVHTVTGATALVLALPQLSARLRARRLVLHRWTGRAYLLLMATSMVAAYAFLLGAPSADYFGGTAFDLQLWVLASATVASAALAFVAVRRGDVVGHRAWITLNISFMLTAPVLRVVWTALGRLDRDLELMMGIDMGASGLGVLAPGAGAVALVLASGRGARSAVAPGVARQYAAVLAVSLAGSLWLAVRFAQLPPGTPVALVLVGHLLPASCLVVGCLAGAVRAARDGHGDQELRWRWLAWGAALATPAAAATGVLATAVYGPVDGFLAGQMVGASGPIFLAFVALLHAGRRPVGPDAPEPADAEVAAVAVARPAMMGR